MIPKVFDRLASFCLRHSARILVLAGVIGLGAIVAASYLRFDPEILNMIPDNEEVNEFRRILDDLGTIDYHIVVLKFPEGAGWENYVPLVDHLARQYQALPMVEEVEYEIPDPVSLVREVLPNALLLMSPEELELVRARLTDEAIRSALARNRALLQTPQSGPMKELITLDPLNLLPIFLERFQKAGGGFDIDPTAGYYLSSDHSTLLILVKPDHPAQDMAFSRRMMEQAGAIEERALARFTAEQPDVALPVVAYTGGYAIAFDDAELIKKDVIANVIFSFFGVLLLFIYAFRRLSAIAYAGIPMSLAIAMTFGFAGLALGVLSSAAASFAALLAGLGIDFITVLYERYVEERNADRSMPIALTNTIRSTLPGVVIAAVTTAATFYGFLVTDFRAMTHLGLLTGTGILFFFFCVAFVLPALIVQVDGRSKKIPRLYLHTFGSDKLIALSLARPRVVVAAWAIFLVIAAILAFRIEFSDNIENLRASDNRGVLEQTYLTETFGSSFDFMMLVTRDQSMQETLEETAEMTAELDPLVADGTIGSYQAITTFIPPRSQQEQVIATIVSDETGAFDPDRIRRTFLNASDANGFREGVWRPFLDSFEQALRPTDPLSIDDVDNPALERLSRRFIQRTDDGDFLSVAYIYPTTGVWGREVPESLMAVGRGGDQRALTGVNLVSAVLRKIVRADAFRATLLGFVTVLILLSLGFRSVRRALLIFVPFVAGCIGMLGLMAALGIDFNFMNIFVGLMLVGVGTDYGIYMVQRYLENPYEFPLHAGDTGKAVVMAALTSIIGFGSFALSHYPGLRSIGYASFFGIGLSGLGAITLLPAILVLQRKPDPEQVEKTMFVDHAVRPEEVATGPTAAKPVE